MIYKFKISDTNYKQLYISMLSLFILNSNYTIKDIIIYNYILLWYKNW